ncbi:hypothetical protein [Helicobacter sp. MIT 14-3879]|nr:hypothetical protein [Helicobacter sp. MIT 14-3879]
MGFEILGYKFFNLTQKVTYADAFLTIGVVCLVSLGLFLVAKYKAPK